MVNSLRDLAEKIAEELLSQLEGSVPKEKILNQAYNLLKLGIPPEEVKRTIAKKYGIYYVSKLVKKKIGEIIDGDSRLEVTGKILMVRRVETGSGVRYLGVLADETGSINFTATTEKFQYQPGDVIRVRNAFARTSPTGMRLYITDKSTVSLAEEEIFLEEVGACKIKDIKDGMRGVELKVKVARISPGKGKVKVRGILCDETGRAPFVCWNEVDLEEGDNVKIIGAFVRSWRGIVTIHIDQNTTIERIPEEIECQEIEVTPIYEILEKGGLDVSISGIVVEVRPRSGLVKRCEICGAVLGPGGECPRHGKVKGVLDLRAKIVVDDGTGAITAILKREVLERLLNVTLEEMKRRAQEEMDPEVVLSYLKERLLGAPITLRGDCVEGALGYTFFAAQARFENISSMADKVAYLMERLEE